MAKKNQGVAAEKVKIIGKIPLPPIPNDSPLRSHCYLCGQASSPLEIEHVVPRVLFKGYDAVEYIKLWSCRECNQAKGMDDEFVARHLQATSFTPTAQKGFESALRGFRRENHGQGLGRELAKNMEWIEVTTQSGIVLGNAPA